MNRRMHDCSLVPFPVRYRDYRRHRERRARPERRARDNVACEEEPGSSFGGAMSKPQCGSRSSYATGIQQPGQCMGAALLSGRRREEWEEKVSMSIKIESWDEGDDCYD